MRAFLLFLFLLLISLCLPSSTFAQETLTTSTLPVEISGMDSITLQIPADLDTFQYTDLTFFLEGGDGGKADRGNDTGRSGDGAQVSVKFPLGRGANSLRPGGLIRFVVGARGQNAGGGSTNGGAGGGGGTAILYKDPGVSHSSGTIPALNLANSRLIGWTLLAVAGGGGGGYVNANSNSDGRPGQSDRDGSDSRSVGGNSNAGGINGAAGVDQSNDGSGAGCGYSTSGNEGNNGYNGKAGGITGKKGDDFANRSGGFGYGPGGHGRTNRGGGGGGGYSGGGAGRNNGSGGGGGGSFASGASTATTIIERDDNNSPDDGFITYTFTEDPTPGPAPDVICKDMITVVINDGNEVVVTGDLFDDGSTNPIAGELEYLVCLSFGGTFTCIDQLTRDCDNLGMDNAWHLGVANSADTSVCATPTIINTIAGTATAPTCPSDRTVDLDDGCVGNVPSQQLRPVSEGDCSDLGVSLVLPNTEVVNNPPNFFNTEYDFIAGTTLITYTNTVGSCSFEVTLNAGSIPNISCPNNHEREAMGCDRNIRNNITEFDNDTDGLTYRITDGTIDATVVTGMGNIGDYDFLRGVNTVEYFLEDDGGCVSNCSFTVTITGDGEDRPVVNCVSTLEVEYSPDLNIMDSLPLGLISATDDCGILRIDYSGANVECNRIGTPQPIEIEVFDIDGNPPERCEFNLILRETTPPDARCREPFTRSLNAGGSTVIRATDINDGTTADCDFDLRIEGPSNGVLTLRCNALGENVVTMRATNDEGNEASATCSTIVTIVDNRVPDAVCQNTTLILSEMGEAFLAPTNLDNGSSDNCTITDFAASKTAFDCDDIGANNVTLTIIDQSGNNSNCSSIVTIQDSPNAYCATILPVDLTSFNGEVVGKENRLNWSVEREDAFSHYEIQRSAGNAMTWTVLGAVAGTGGSETAMDYSYVDNNPPVSAYYRLRMVDLDGSFAYSPVVALLQEIDADLSVYPNPNNGQFSVILPTEAPSVLRMISTTGKVVLETSTQGTSLNHTGTTLPPGLYWIVVQSSTKTWTKRMIIQ